MKVVLNEPEEDVPTEDGDVTSVVESNFTEVIVEESENPFPVTVTTSPTCPEVSLRVTAAVLALTVASAEETTAPVAASLTTTRPVLPLTVSAVDAGIAEELSVNWLVAEHAVGELVTPDSKQ